jgi:O-antigen/teichoic acid export membrane protein
MVSRNNLSLLTGRIAQLLLAIISVRVATGLLAVEQYGMLALLTGFQSLFGLLLISPVGQYILRHTHQWAAEGLLLSRLRRYNLYVSIVAAVAVAVVMVWIPVHREDNVHVPWLAALAVGLVVYVGTLNGCLVSLLNMLGHHGVSVYLAFLTTLAALMSSVAVSFSGHAVSAVLWLTGQSIGTGLVSALALQRLHREIRPTARATIDPTFLTWNIVLSFCFPLAITAGFSWVMLSGYRFIVEWVWGMRALGFMAVGLAVAGQVWSACEGLLMQFFIPPFYKAVSEGTPCAYQRAYSNFINTVMPIYLLLLGVTLSCGGWLMAVLVDAKYHEAYEFVIYGVGIEWCRAMAGLLSQAAQATKQTKYLIGPFALSSFVAMVGCVGVAWIHAPLGAVSLVLLVAGLFLVLSMGWQMNGLLHIHIEWRGLLSMGFLACAIFSGALLFGLKPISSIESVLPLTVVGVTAGLGLYIFIKLNSSCRALNSVNAF